jgi:5-methylcytosine-specific restriction endonuclease McrBC GTP-binding regulatory subunit McrB
MKRQYRYDGKIKAKYYEDDDLADAKKDDVIIDKVIQYDFIPQAFTNAYIKAWQTEEPVYLIIEEINRGNCAQIFGDLFQLLDRDENGYSKYPIDADTDLKNYLAEKFSESCRDDIEKEIEEGYKLKLPNNFYIWATMNTSDQSLFPIDSAFKRRWDWKYIKIKKGIDKETKKELDWKIKVGDDSYDWWEFLKAINYKIDKMTSSADKQLGYFFCLADGKGEISADTFVNKVAFYLWNDVFKDYAEDGSPLLKYKKKEDDKSESDLTFPDFFDESGNVDPNVVKQFIVKVLTDDNTDNKAE